MDNKFKANTRIPIYPRPVFKNTTSTVNSIASGSTNTLKPSFRPNTLRRSKSLTDFRTITKSNFVEPKTTAGVRKPFKRPALTETKVLPNKILKVDKKEPEKPKVTKPAPYDYKARFNLLKEQHDKLKLAHRNLKETHESTADQNEDLLTKYEHNQKELQLTKTSLECTKTQLQNLTVIHEETAQKNKELTITQENLQKELDITKNSLHGVTAELKHIKGNYDELVNNLQNTQKKLDEHVELLHLLKVQLHSLENEKKKLHNSIQELKGNIRVFCRIRPSLTDEEHKMLYAINYLEETSIEISNSKEKRNEFSFDRVFGPNSTQQDIFEELSQLVQSALDGYNVCVFAYGQTGSGKTYTMEGGYDDLSRGMIPRSIDTIFESLENLKYLGWKYTVKASFLEIYNENIIDLLDPKKTNLEIRMSDNKGTDVYVPNLSIEEISNAEHLLYLMRIAQKHRAVAATENNERSSRSHSVTKISLEGLNDERGIKCVGNLNLVDLAGSEKFHTNETTRLRETTNINKSLSNLSNVIMCLVKKNSHIPYRNSKLTHLLMPSLGGNSKTLMLVNISPLETCFNESVNSLRFATNVNQCKTGSIKRMKIQN